MELVNLSPKYQFNVGDIIITHDERIGIITERTNAHQHMAYSGDVCDSIIRSYMQIPIYKVLIGGSISHIGESNIMESIQCD